MRKLIKNQEGKVVVLMSPTGFIPRGWEEVPQEELASEEIALAKSDMMAKIRARRDEMLLTNDKAYIIALKDGASTEDILADREILKNVPQSAEEAMDEMESVEEIKAYDAFNDLELAGEY